MKNNLRSELNDLRRPALLLKAARFGAAALMRAGRARPAGVQGSLSRLLSEEAELDEKRRDGEAGYSPRRHIELLMTLLVEAQERQAV